MPSEILVCTVGGSHQPILTALRLRPWDRIVFVCSAQTPTSRGSAVMITDAVEIQASETRSAQRLDPIPVQAGIATELWEILEVPPDDPDAAFGIMAAALARLRRDGASIVADYTGGTKSMSAALFLAALEVDAKLQLVTGQRADLVRVADLTERSTAIQTHLVAAAREFERLAAGWQRFAYQEAAEGFERLRNDLKEAGLGRDELARFNRAQELSSAFAAWDCFDHKKAAGVFKKGLYRNVEISGRSDWSNLAAALACGQDGPWGALQLVDLWHNAQRCAARGRYDDAVARLYRFWEAMAQWLLRVDCCLNPSVVEFGLKQSWNLYRHLRPDGVAAAFWRRSTANGGNEWERLDEKLRLRNHSIWAHGFDPVGERGWERLSRWTETGLLEVLGCEAPRLGEPCQLPQLPETLPAF